MNVDLVLEGGGVKGIALVGALSVLEEHGFTVHRVAGSSAGAIVGALAAAGMPAGEMKEAINGLKYGKFADRTLLDHVPVVGGPASILFGLGEHQGAAFEEWIAGHLKALGKETFADLADHDTNPASATHDPARAFKLIVTASDISNRRLALLPWDFTTKYPSTLADAKVGERSVAAAVRCSMSIPFYFRPAHLDYVLAPAGEACTATVVDGGMLSNYPVQVFDRRDGGEPRWPTIGIKLGVQRVDGVPPKIGRPDDYAKALVKTMMGSFDRWHMEDPTVVARTIFVNTLNVSATDFDRIDRDPQLCDDLYENGRKAARLFLDGDGTPAHPPWDFEAYKRMMKAKP